jgi:hypothetical protein
MLVVTVAHQNLDAYRQLYARLTPAEDAASRKAWNTQVPRMRAVYGSCVDEEAIKRTSTQLST